MKCHLNILLLITNLSVIRSANIQSVDYDTAKAIWDIFGTPTTATTTVEPANTFAFRVEHIDNDTLKTIIHLLLHGSSTTKIKNVFESATEFTLSPHDKNDDTAKAMLDIFRTPRKNNNVFESTTEVSLSPHDENDDTAKAILEIFRTPRKNNNVLESSTKFSLSPPKLVGASNDDCTREDGQKGVCVTYYQCDPETKRLITSGETLIDIRKKECEHYLEVCCLPDLVYTTSRDRRDSDNDKPKQPSPMGCGYSNVGGLPFVLRRIDDDDESNARSEYGEFPWVVAILKNTAPEIYWEQKSYLGGGAIIHLKVVLTAAHKIYTMKPSEIKCRAGEWNTQNNQEIHPHQERVASKIVKHTRFRPGTTENSIALIILERPFDATPTIGVGCIAPSLPMSGVMCKSAGWGQQNFNNANNYASILKKVNLPLVSYEGCQKALRGTSLGQHFELHTSFICAGGGAADTCTGDGGSPLVCPISEKRYAITGLVAWGVGCKTPGVPGVYVNVPKFKNWIDHKMTEEVNDTSSYNYV